MGGLRGSAEVSVGGLHNGGCKSEARGFNVSDEGSYEG